MAEKIEVMLTEDEVNDRIKAIGEQISCDYAGRQVHLVCVLKGGSFLCVNLPSESQFLYRWILCPSRVMAEAQNRAGLLR